MLLISNMNGVFNELTVCDNAQHIIPYSDTALPAIHGLIIVITKFANSIK